MIATIGQALAWNSAHRSEHTAIVDGDQRFTYAQHWDRVSRAASALSSLGIGKGDRIAVLSMNTHEYIEVYHAAALLSAAVVPMNFRYTPEEVVYVVSQSESRALLVQEQFTGLVRDVSESIPFVRGRTVQFGKDVQSPFLSFERLLSESSAEQPAAADPNDCFFQGYTAGTTGFPKGCVNPHAGFVDFFKRTAMLWGLMADDVVLMPAPLFHEAPTLFTLTQLFLGGTAVITDEPTPSNIFKLIDSEKPTWSFMVPTMWQSLVAARDIGEASDLESLRTLVSAGQPLLTGTKEALLDLFPKAGLNEFYGGTEVGIVTNLAPQDQRRKTRCVGKPVFGYDVSLRDDMGRLSPQGDVGEIYIRGPILLREYYNNPDATKKAFAGEWITLGDMGRFDEEGFLYIVDRKNDMIITGGENVFPNEIEAELHSHSGIEGAVVIGVSDPRWGEAIKAVVVRSDPSLTEADVLAFCKERLADYKVPKSVDFVEELPTSSFGKILRREVRSRYWPEGGVRV